MDKQIVIVVMDGVGLSETEYGNAVKAARTPVLDKLMAEFPFTKIKAHGTAVGLPSDEDMGNSEVGHNAIGCGSIYSQGAKLVNESITSGRMFKSETWNDLTENCRKNFSALHFIGLLSDGNVHSNIAHLFAMLKQAKTDGICKVRVHILLDGRDVPATSAHEYIQALENELTSLRCDGFDCKIASGGGRMKITMDRYEADWNMVKTGWETHVLGIGRQFNSALSAIETLRAETSAIDQDLPPFVIAENGEPVGKILDGDSVILFNFRGDRAIEISQAFDCENFTKFDRKRVNVVFAGMLQYDGDLKLPEKFLVKPPKIEHTMTEYLIKNHVKQFAVSETQKFGHVTYFWNGNRSEKFSEEYEDYFEIPSDRVSFDERPWMKAAEITDKLIEAMKSGKYGFLRANFPNGDMVGHTGNFEAAVIAVETVDICLARILKAADDCGSVVIITADHGNADEMLEKSKDDGEPRPKTSHTLNPVPFIVYKKNGPGVVIKPGKFGLSNIAASIFRIFGFEKPEMWDESIVE